MSFFGFSRRRRATASILAPDSPEDWSVGDVAVCKDLPQQWRCVSGNCSAHGPVAGQMLPVTVVVVALDRQWLGFAAWPNEVFAALWFNKVRPDAHEACDAEFVKLLKRAPAEVSA